MQICIAIFGDASAANNYFFPVFSGWESYVYLSDFQSPNKVKIKLIGKFFYFLSMTFEFYR